MHALVLTTFHFGLPIPDSVNRGILSALIEHLELSRTNTIEHRANQAKMLRHKLAGKRIGIIFAQGAPALDFVTTEGKDLFPDAALLSVLTLTTTSLTGNSRKVMNVHWRIDPAGTLRTALDLFPQTRRVIVASGARDSAMSLLSETRKAFAPSHYTQLT